MAITIEQSPPLYSPVYNETVFVLSSTNVANQNFTLRATIKDSADTTLALVKVPPRPDDYIVIDIARIVESEIQWDFDKILNQTTGIQRSSVFERYTVEFQEEYGATPAASGAITTTTGYNFNASMRYQQFTQYAQNDWLLGGATRKFLTNSPRSLYIREDESAELGMMHDGSNLGYMSIKTYDSAGNLIQECTVDYPFAAADEDKFLSFLTGTDDLNQTTLTTGAQPVIDSSVFTYTVQARTGTPAGINAASSETITYTIDRDCTRYTPIRLHFLNRMGHFDSFTFKMLNRQTIDKNTKSFKKFTGDLVGTTWTNSQNARGNVTFDTQVSYQYEVNSDWITEDESEWLQELFNSPVVFWQESPNDPTTTYAVTIKDTSYQVMQRVNDRLFNYLIRFDLAITDSRQRA